MSQFSTLLEAQWRTLLDRWLSRLSEEQKPDVAPVHPEPRLQQVMGALISALRGQPVQPPHLPHFGDDARAEVREYELLADVLLDLAADANQQLTPEELRVFTRFMLALTRDVVAVHARPQERAQPPQPVPPAPKAPRKPARRQKLFEMTVGGNWALDVVSRRVIAEPALLALHHLDAGAPVQLDALRAAIHPDDRAELEAVVLAALNPQGSGQYQLEYRVRTAPQSDERYRWVQTTARTLFEHGVARQIVGTALEVTQRKEAELAREGLLEAIEAAPLVQLMVLEGPDLVIQLVNDEYRRNVSRGRDIVGMPLYQAFPQFAEWDAAVKSVMHSGQPFLARNLLAPIEGEQGLEDRYFDFVVQPLRGGSGTIDSLVTLSVDVTSSVEARRMLEAFVAQEKQRAGLERHLIGVVSHDLGNPLAVLKLSVRQLLEPKAALEPGAEKLVHAMEVTLEGMARLVNDLLDFTEARQGSGLSIVRAPMNFHEAVQHAVDELRPLFPQRVLLLEHEGDGVGSWDRLRLTQATANLVTNALKYGLASTPVRVRTQAFPDRVELRVNNEGEPIPAELVPRLFEPMKGGRAHPPELGRSVGLGLFIVKHIVDALGGSVSVTSTAESGTTFLLSFPR